MAETHGTANVSAPADDLDDLYDYDVDTPDLFREFVPNMDAPALPQTSAKAAANGLGVDEEIKVKKARKPIAKLNEERLLSQAGIPKLRRITRERIKFRGKGHEYSDVARLLNLYQLWLDDLYPRAKFADGLAIIEKLGHTKRMQTMRHEWINEGKPKNRYEEERAEGKRNPTTQASLTQDQRSSSVAATGEDRNRNTDQNSQNDNSRRNIPFVGNKNPENPQNDDDMDDSLFVSDDEELRDQPDNIRSAADEPADDELDILLAEDAQREAQAKASGALEPRKQADDNFEDEMEAMADMDMW